MCDDDKTDKGDSQRSNQGPAKVRAVENAINNETMLNTMMVTAQNAEATRINSGAIYVSVLMLAQLVAPAVKTIKDFAELTRGKSKHNLGHPHVQAWATFMTTLIQHSADSAKEGTLAKCLQNLQESLTAFKTDGVEKAYMHISQFRAKITKEETHGVVSWCLSPMLEPLAATNLNRALVELLVHHKAEVTMGGPPPGPAERKLKADIAELKRKMGKTK